MTFKKPHLIYQTHLYKDLPNYEKVRYIHSEH